MQIAVGISLLSCIEAEIKALPVLAAAILNFSLPVSTSIFFDSTVEFLDAENTGIASGIALQSCLEADMQVHPVLAAAILNLSFLVSKYGPKSLFDSAIKFSEPESMDSVSKMCIVT
jgi:hypothetical protein